MVLTEAFERSHWVKVQGNKMDEVECASGFMCYYDCYLLTHTSDSVTHLDIVHSDKINVDHYSYPSNQSLCNLYDYPITLSMFNSATANSPIPEPSM